MTEEQKNIVLLGSRYETMNKYIDLSNDDGTIAKGIAEAMQEYAERYHIAQTKKLHQPTVSGRFCKECGNAKMLQGNGIIEPICVCNTESKTCL